MAIPFAYNAQALDLSKRVVCSTTVVASPTAATEVVVASVTVPGDLQYASGVVVVAFAAFTVGTDGVTANLRIRQTSVSGSTKAATGATTVVAANLRQLSVVAFDTAPADAQVYRATLEVGSASAGSTVSGVALFALAV